LWWLLRWLGHERVAVLDGGLQAWLDADGPMDTAEPEITPKDFLVGEVRYDRVVVTGDIPLEISAGALLLDARSAERYRGEQEPIDPVAGHIPDAENLPFTELVGPDGRFLPPIDLRERLETALDGREASAVITMCGSGVTACHLSLGFVAAGLHEGRLYAGSWSEWIRDNGREISIGDD
jgi:thiosulfate/3-mercaptopyruvate sulfurtransferase